MYAKVLTPKVIEIVERPTGAFGNISNVESLPDSELITLMKIYPFEYSNDPKQSPFGESFYTNTISYDIQPDKVIGTYDLTRKPDKEVSDMIIARVKQTLDAGAQKQGYDDILSAVSYDNSTNEQFKADAEKFIKWRDDVWAYVFGLDVGNVETLDEVFANIPALDY